MPERVPQPRVTLLYFNSRFYALSERTFSRVQLSSNESAEL